MSKKRISANEFVKDIRAGMSNSSLMMKYQISSEEKLQNLLKKFVAAGHLQLSEIDERSHIFKCPACGKFHYEEFSECPSCGIIVSKFVAKKAEENKKVGNDQNIIINDISKESNEKEIDDKKRVITISFVLSWIFGALFLLSGVTSIFTKPLIGLMMLVMAAALLPPIVNKFENKFNIKITRNIKTFVLLACFFVIAVIGSIEGEIRRTKQEKIAKESTTIEKKKTSNLVPRQKKSVVSKELSPEMKANIQKYVNDRVRTKKFIKSGFWDGASLVQIHFELDVRYLGNNPKMAAKQFSDNIALQASRIFKRSFCIHTYYGNHNKLSRSCEVF